MLLIQMKSHSGRHYLGGWESIASIFKDKPRTWQDSGNFMALQIYVKSRAVGERD